MLEIEEIEGSLRGLAGVVLDKAGNRGGGNRSGGGSIAVSRDLPSSGSPVPGPRHPVRT